MKFRFSEWALNDFFDQFFQPMTLKSSLRGAVAPFAVMDMLRTANAYTIRGRDIIHLELGEPGVPVPSGVQQAARHLMDQGLPGYTDSRGIEPLRTRIAAFYDQRYDLTVPPQDVFITTGSSGAFILAFLAAFDVGDRVALATPGYPAYRTILSSLGLTPVPVRVGPEDDYQLDVTHLQSLDQPVDGLLVASPSNPTGSMIPQHKLAMIAQHCRDNGIRLISDEIYHGISYDQPGETVRKHNHDAIIINSFSKYFAMPGWRLGWMIAPHDLGTAIERLAQNLYISTSSLGQHAALAAFDCLDELNAHVTTYARNRSLFLDALPEVGLPDIAKSSGAFYLYVALPETAQTSPDFCARLLDETGIATTPGTDFDPEQGTKFIRISYSAPTPQIKEAIKRLYAWKHNLS